MKYYKIKKEYDNKTRKDNNILIQNELYTEREKEKYNIPDKYCDIVNVSKNTTYFFFGARFCELYPYNS